MYDKQFIFMYFFVNTCTINDHIVDENNDTKVEMFLHYVES